mgnify:CR=1 FL=1
MSIFEALMLVCFGSAWPVSIYKSYTSRTNSGKSLGFLFIIFVGYLSGVIHKIIYSQDIVIYLYILNALMVFVDIILYFRNKKYDKQ